MTTDYLSLAREMHGQIVEWRRDIHRHPEMGFQEHRTAKLVADTLEKLGLAVQTGVGKTGVVARLGRGRPAIGIRADMDALAIREANDVPYASQTDGVMHACGHDAHTAMLLGCARLLHALPERPPGEVRFLFQPMEEAWDEDGRGGAFRMIVDGAMEGLDAVIGLHVDSSLECGALALRSGPVMAGVDPYDAVILGTSSHSGAPHEGVNPVVLLAHVIHAIQAIPSSYTHPLQPALISTEAVRADSSSGVIPGEASLHGNIRYYDADARRAMHRHLKNALETARTLGGDYRLDIQEVYPPTANDPDLTTLVRRCAVDLVGEGRVYPMEPSLAGEDFGYMASQAPGVYFHLGVGLDGDYRPHHSPRFDIDEAALPVGTAILAAAACAYLQEHR